MPRVYAKFIPAAFFPIMACLAVLLLTGCEGGGMAGYGSGWDGSGSVVVNSGTMPNAGWQTQGQRQDLDRQQAEGGAVLAPAARDTSVTDLVAAQRKVSVSLLVPLTGRKSDLGQSMLKSAQMALFDIGATNVELNPRDTHGTADGAAAAARAAVAANDNLILGPIFADDVRAVKPVAAAAGIPVIAFTTDWTLAGDGAYIMGFSPFTQVLRVARYAQAHGHPNVGFFGPKTEYGDAVLRTMEGGGARPSQVGRYTSAPGDLAKSVQEFADAARNGDGFDFGALMLPLGSEGLRSLVAALNKQGISQPKVAFLGTGLWDDPALSNYPPLFGGLFAAPDPALRVDFEKRYRDMYAEPPQRLSSLAYDATALAAVLARTAESGQSPYTHAALTHPRGFAGIDGIFRFRNDGLSERGLAVLEIKSGSARVVDPAPAAFTSGS